MAPNTEYNSKERIFLWCLATAGFVILNIAFGYGLFFKQDALFDALKNPISPAFFAEALLLMGAFAYLLTKWQVAKLHWIWFLVLSLLGSMAFALPIVLLWPLRKK
jgi:hypothetical protein